MQDTRYGLKQTGSTTSAGATTLGLCEWADIIPSRPVTQSLARHYSSR